MLRTLLKKIPRLGASALWLAPAAAFAQTSAPAGAAGTSPPDEPSVAVAAQGALAEVVVSGEREERASLATLPRTGSRLGLSVRETPATIDVLTQRELQDLGARSTEEALNRAPGVVSNTNPTSPGMLSMRGFTGSGRAVLLLYDGVRPAEESFFTRVFDSWLFERIEVLKGPASVDFGEGALAGVVNLVPKRARLGAPEVAGQVGYGSFRSFRAAADANVPLAKSFALRPVVAHSRSSGYVDDARSESTALSVSALWIPTDALTLELAVDHFRDAYDAAYFGTPLVPRAAARAPSELVESADGRVLDRSLRRVNYNVEDASVDSDTEWIRARATYELAPGWSLSNRAHGYFSDRRFIDAEYFGYNPESGLVDRSTGVVTHDFEFWTDQLELRGDFTLAGRRNRVAVGGMYSDADFFSQRRFGSTTSVDPRDPVRGSFPVGDDASLFGRREDRDSNVRSLSAFAEDALNLTERWLLLGGLRYDHVRVDRTTLDLNASPEAPGGVRRDFDELTWRVGSVYELGPEASVFLQYSTAASPPSSLVALSPGDARFDMTRGRALEGGLKAAFFEARVLLGVSGFYIEQDGIVTRSPLDPTLSVQGGEQSSRGVELSVSLVPLPELRLDANYTQFDARFDTLTDAAGNDLGGNTPARVPERLLNAFVYFTPPALPLTASVGVHHSGRYFTDDVNGIEVSAYTTLEAALRYRLELGGGDTDVTLRGRNLTDALYAGYTDISPDQLTIAPPQSVDLLLTTRY